MAIKVTLRSKNITNDRKSLYLDFYPQIINPETGKPTRREFLKMYTFNKGSELNKQHNKETLQLAEQIRQRRENDLNKPEIYTQYERNILKQKALQETNFVDYFLSLAKKRTKSNNDNWMSAYYHLTDFTNGSLKIADLNVPTLEALKEYLLQANKRNSKNKKLSQNSASSYFNKVKAALKQAFRDDLLPKNLNEQVAPIKEADTQRNALTLEEVNKLIKTECQDQQLKKAAIFSILTGLRFSDIQKMVWGEIEQQGTGDYICRYQSQKTGVYQYQPIPEAAVEILGDSNHANERVIQDLKYSAHTNKKLKQWVRDAGITKKITFHCFRHTYATLQLTGGTGFYTVSKMLGHSNISTTQIYAKVVDDLKKKTTNVIKLDM